jgi:hypothetical protein
MAQHGRGTRDAYTGLYRLWACGVGDQNDNL